MAIAWTPRLAVGVEQIDAQHRELFDRINKLLAAMESQQGQAEVARVVDFLGDYVVTHFGAEERLMQRHAYPDYRAHKQLHDDFVKVLGGLRAELVRQGPSAALAVQLNHRVGDWLIDHIGRTDRALAAHLAKQAPGTRA